MSIGSLIGRLVDYENREWFTILMAILVAVITIYNLQVTFGLCSFYDEWEEIDFPDLPDDNYSCDELTAQETADQDKTVDENVDFYQSPLNIDSSSADHFGFHSELIWLRYDNMPKAMCLENNGHTLLLRANYNMYDRLGYGIPRIGGADLLGNFRFQEISFRWGNSNNIGSEHTIDNISYPLEMQCVHKADHNIADKVLGTELLIISFLFVDSVDNLDMDVITRNLIYVQCSGQFVQIPCFPLSRLIPIFYTDFYSYHGSITVPPYHCDAERFVYPIPLPISQRQLNAFRKLRFEDNRQIEFNARSVQGLSDWKIKFNSFCDSKNSPRC